MKTRNSFTLIEILTVIIIIGILAAILFPTLAKIKDQGRATETKSTLSAISISCKTFKSDYQTMPYSSSTESDSDIGASMWTENYSNKKISDSAYLEFFNILTYANSSNTDGTPSSKAKEFNPKGVHYLDTPKNFFRETTNSIRDGWNRPIYVILDLDGNGQIKLDAKYDSSSGTYNNDVIAISRGPQDSETSNNTGRFIFSTGKK